MEILFYKDVLLRYLSNSFENQQDKKNFYKILNNENSSFLFSKKFLKFIKSELDEEDEMLYQSLYTKLADDGYNIRSSETAETFEEELFHIYSKSQTNIVAHLAYQKPTEEVLSKIPNMAIFSEIEKPNFHWLVAQLVIQHPHKVDLKCFDFQENIEVDLLFESIFQIPKHIEKVCIFNTFCNLEHDKFRYLISEGIKVEYYTKCSGARKRLERQESINQKFNHQTKTFFTKPKEKAHGRRIIFENIIISCDNDFQNLTVNAADWVIDVQYSESDAKEWLKRCEKYQEF